MILETITNGAGQAVRARFFEPVGEPRASVLLVPAMGASQQVYAAFARWLAAQGYLVATFDYTVTNFARAEELRRKRADVLDRARDDCNAMVDALKGRLPERPLYWVGHSLGGQILDGQILGGQMPALVGDKVTKAVTIDTRDHSHENAPVRTWRGRHFIASLAAKLLGGSAERAAVAQPTPMTVISVTDDERTSARSFGFFRSRFENPLWRPRLLPELA